MRKLRQLPDPSVGADEAAETARSVLSGRAYVEAARPPSLRERFFEWIQDVIGDLLNALSSGGGRGVIAWIIVGAFLLVIGFLLYRLLARFEPASRVEGPPDPEIQVAVERSAAEWLAAAAEHEAAGEWRLGLRCRHRALTVELIDADLADPRPGMTAATLSRQAGSLRPSLAAPLGDATALFESTWYGFRSAGPAERDEFVRLAEQVRTALAVVPA